MAGMVVVGGGAAGMSAASVAKRRDPDLDVVVLERGGFVSFSACGMPYWLSGKVTGEAERLVVVRAEDARKDRGLDVRLGAAAVAADAAERTVRVRSPEGEEDLAYDHLVLATGARAVVPFPTRGLAGVHVLRHLDDGVALRREIERSRPRRAVVVGGGFVGVEMAEAFHDLGVETTLVHSRPTVLSGLVDAELGALVNERMEAAGIRLLAGRRATGLAGEGHVDGVEAGGETVPGDVVVLGLGADPRSRLAEALGCTLHESGAVKVDARMRTGVPGVWACGDAVAFPHRVTGASMFLPLALHANRAGRIVGENVTGGAATFPGVLGTTITRFLDLEVAVTGLGTDAARAAGFDPVSATIKSGSKAIYFPGSQKLRARVIVDRTTQRVLGAQTVGGPGTAKRIDTMAAAIWFGATAREVEDLDLAYAPPFSPVWDPWAIAARQAAKAASS